jgi:hypothetical protein
MQRSGTVPCITVTGYQDFVQHLALWKRKKTQCFRNWNTYPVIEANLFYRTKLRKYSLPSHLRMETDLISRMMCFLFRTPDGGRCPEFQQ